MKQYLLNIMSGGTLTRQEAHDILIGITEQRYAEPQIAALLMGIQQRGIRVDEFLGFRDALLETGTHIDFDDENTIDIVGTGGDGKNTFNISTCAAFVIAGAGYKVTKHGNGGSTSVSGASNLLQHHGVRFSSDPDLQRRSLDQTGIAYFHAPLFAHGMKHVGGTRKAISIPTFFNLLGPMINPCQPKNTLHGTATLDQLRLYTSVHHALGDNFGVVTSYDGYDEVSLTGSFRFYTRQFEDVFSPSQLGMQEVLPSELFGGNTIQEASRIFDSVLEGRSSEAQRNVVLANAACAISIISHNDDLPACVAEARESLEAGRALNVFRKFIEINS